MQFTRLTDFLYAFRLLDLLRKPWVEQEAYKFGIISSTGEPLRKWGDLRTAEEKNSYSYFHRIVFNMRRFMEKVPGFDNKVLQVAVALRLLREHSEIHNLNISEAEISYIGQMLLKEDTPTNVTGSAVSTDINSPINKKSDIVRRKDAEIDDLTIKENEMFEAFDPMSAVIIGMGALAAFPIAKKVAQVVEPIIDYFKSSSPTAAKQTDALKRLKLVKDMASKATGEEKAKLNALAKSIERKLSAA